MFGKGLKDGIPIGLGYFSVSFSFGIIAVSNGFTWWEAVLISMTNLTSAGQFAGVTVMAAMGSFIEIALTQFVINLRYALMSISLSQKLSAKFGVFSRLIFGAGITDEIFAVAMNNKGEISRKYMAGLIVIPYIGWSAGTLAGAICGDVLPEIICNGLGIALYAMFIAIVLPVVKHDKTTGIVVAVAAALSCMIRFIPGLSWISAGFSVIICGIVASAVGAVIAPDASDEEGDLA